MEIEHKFLVRSEFRDQATEIHHIRQAYLSDDPSRTVRVRIEDHRATLTIKGRCSESGLSRYEWEHEISESDAAALMELCLEGAIDKHRYIVPYKNHCWEVDEFHGHLQGLVVAEIEVESESESFALPCFVGEEITGDKRYYNSQLRKKRP